MPLDEDINEDVPQAQTEGIARRLLGDDLVNRYGDVIGARKPTAADVLRDFTIGFTKGADKADELKMKVRDTYENAYAKRQRAAIAQAQQDGEKVKTMTAAIREAAKYPGYATGILKEALAPLGLQPTPTVLKMMADIDLMGNTPLDELDAAADDGKGTVVMGAAAAAMGSPLNFAKFLSENARRRRDDQATGNAIIETQAKRLKLKRDKLKFAQEKKKAPLSIRDAQLSNQIKEKRLNKPDVAIGMTGVPEIDAELAGSDETASTLQPAPTTAPATSPVTAPLATPSQTDVDAAKARLGLR